MNVTAHHVRLTEWAERLRIIDMNLLDALDDLYWEAFGAGMDAAAEGLIKGECE